MNDSYELAKKIVELEEQIRTLNNFKDTTNILFALDVVLFVIAIFLCFVFALYIYKNSN